jgi:hypothetical protein
MKKLSKAQIGLLRILRDENTTVHTYMSGLNRFASIPDKDYRVDIRTVFKLADGGFIENITEDGWQWRGSTYKITEAGLGAIEGK